MGFALGGLVCVLMVGYYAVMMCVTRDRWQKRNYQRATLVFTGLMCFLVLTSQHADKEQRMNLRAFALRTGALSEANIVAAAYTLGLITETAAITVWKLLAKLTDLPPFFNTIRMM